LDSQAVGKRCFQQIAIIRKQKAQLSLEPTVPVVSELQGHLRSMTSMSSESQYATSY